MKFSPFRGRVTRISILFLLICMSTMPLLAAAEDDTIIIDRPQTVVSDTVLSPTDWMAEQPVDTDAYTTYEEVVPYEVIHINDATLPEGQTTIVQYGQAGRALVSAYVPDIATVTYQAINRAITTAPTAQVIAHGTKPADVGTGTLACPLQDYMFTSPFGMRHGRHHNGVDLAAPKGTPVHAADTGVVAFSGQMNGYGNCIILDHQNGMRTLYAHNSALSVQVDDIVTQNQVIAQVGSTGNSTGNHLHFEVQIDDIAQNPAQYIEFQQ